LEARIDELTLGPPGAAAPLFVTIGRDAPPKRHSSLEKAQRRGAALIRAYKETEVLVLEPVGRIVRGSEWRPR
ncbi:MAG: 1-pyrroline-5-carboxylate dehydrogenase, partial [Burkholderia gladioli]